MAPEGRGAGAAGVGRDLAGPPTTGAPEAGPPGDATLGVDSPGAGAAGAATLGPGPPGGRTVGIAPLGVDLPGAGAVGTATLGGVPLGARTVGATALGAGTPGAAAPGAGALGTAPAGATGPLGTGGLAAGAFTVGVPSGVPAEGRAGSGAGCGELAAREALVARELSAPEATGAGVAGDEGTVAGGAGLRVTAAPGGRASDTKGGSGDRRMAKRTTPRLSTTTTAAITAHFQCARRRATDSTCMVPRVGTREA